MTIKINTGDPVLVPSQETGDDKKIRSVIRDQIRENLKNLEPSDLSLVVELTFLIATNRTDGSDFIMQGVKLMLRCRLLNELLDRSRDQQEKMRLVAQLIDLDRVRRMCGLPLDKIRAGRSTFDHKPAPIGLDYIEHHDVMLPLVNMPEKIQEYLSIKIADGKSKDYTSYVKLHADRISFINFNENKLFEQYEVGGLSEPISRTILINHISFIGDAEAIQIPSFLIAASIVHEAAHIEWDNKHSRSNSKADDLKSEIYAYNKKVKYLERLLEEAPSFDLNDKIQGIIQANIEQIYKAIADMNVQLIKIEPGHEKDDIVF